MNIVAFSGALELGFLYGLVALGVYLSFRVLDFPDLTVDGSLPLGAAVVAALIVKGIPPLIATGLAAGAMAECYEAGVYTVSDTGIKWENQDLFEEIRCKYNPGTVDSIYCG